MGRFRVGIERVVAVGLLIGAVAGAPARAADRIAAGGFHSCRVVAGEVSCWGSNGSGQLGDGSTISSFRPVAVTGVVGAGELAAGAFHTCAMLVGGRVECWGSNLSGQLGDGTTVDRRTAVPVKGVVGAVQLATGSHHTCAVISNGTVKCWGSNGAGRLGDGTNDDPAEPVTVVGITTAVQVAAGGSHSCALLVDGTVRCWGYNYYGELGDGSNRRSMVPVAVAGITTATQLATGYYHSCALLSDASIRCWGSNVSGQLGDGSNVRSTVPVTVAGLTDATGVVTAGYHSCALLRGGTVKCWGNNQWGELGDGTTTTAFPFGKWSPVPVSAIAAATDLSASASHSCVLIEGGATSCWGGNASGQLGDGTNSSRSSPVSVAGPTTGPLPPGTLTAPRSQSSSRSATFALLDRSGGPLECSLDGAPFRPCVGPVTFRSLTEGGHRFQARSLDSAGRVATSTWEWLVDTTAPRLLAKAATGRTRTATATTYRLAIASDVTAVVSLEWSASRTRPSDSAGIVAARTVAYATPSSLRTGGSTVRWIRLRDGAGNWSRWFAG